VGEGKVLGKVDSIQLLVEDHMMETQIMRRSPYVKPFEKDAKYIFFKKSILLKTDDYCMS
jgi:hypothetical protein